MYKAVVLARVSTDEQATDDKASIPEQIKWAKDLCTERGWQFVEGGEYIDILKGYVELENREGFTRLRTDAKTGKFNLVLVWASGRSAREIDIGLKMCRLLANEKVQVYFKNVPVDPMPPDKFYWGANIGDIMMKAMALAGDMQDNVRRSEQVRTGFYGMAKKGKLVNAPYGYKKIQTFVNGKYDWHFELDPLESQIVKRIFSSYLKDGGSIRSVVIGLNTDKVPSPTGVEWNPQTIKNILSDLAYIGKVRWGRKLGSRYKQGESENGKQRRVIAKEEDWIIQDGDHPKIIEEKVFNKAKEKRNIRYILRGRAVGSEGLLTGLVKCGRCGKNGYYKVSRRGKGQGRNGERRDYQCPRYTYKQCTKRHLKAASVLHKIVIDEITKVAENPAYKERLFRKNGNGEQSLLQLKGLEKELKSLKDQEQALLEALQLRHLKPDKYAQASSKIEQKMILVKEQIALLEQELGDKTRAERGRIRFEEIVANFQTGFADRDFGRQKDLIQSLVQSVVVADSVQVNFRL